jgi:hypothetical protein
MLFCKMINDFGLLLIVNEHNYFRRVSVDSPFFNGNDYAYWKAMLIIYLQSIYYYLWLFIENEPHKPTKIENDIIIPKPRSEYTNSDKKVIFYRC